MTKPYVVVAITKHGVQIARTILERFSAVDVYYPAKLAIGDEDALGIHVFEGSVTAYVPELFNRYQGMIGVFSLGAMVRMVAPLLKDKKTDPAVLVIDDRAKHVISVLSGHLGGANRLTEQIAKILDADPVITTASDVNQTLAVDMLGRDFGWEIENFEKVTGVSAAVVNERRVHIIQEAGEKNWWTYNKALPPYLHVYDNLDAAVVEPFDAALVITDRLLTDEECERFLANGVLYRPKSLVAGVGCNSGTSAEEIEEVLIEVFRQANLSMQSVRNLATIDLKQREPGLIEVCGKHKWALHTYTAAELNTIKLANPSETVYKYVGAYGVSEPAARLSSGASGWIVEKVKSGNVTVSICRVCYTPANERKGVLVQ